MKPVSHPSNTRTLGAPAGWDQSGLPVEPLGITDTEMNGVPCVTSFWQPEAEELAHLQAGALVGLSIVGRTMPPAAVVTFLAPVAPHADDLAVDRFAAAMKDKLATARAKGRGGWQQPDCTREELSAMLREHVEKGDPRDAANFAMFLHQRGEGIAALTQADPEQRTRLREVIGQTLSSALAGMCEDDVAPDWYDSRHIDEVLDELMPVIRVHFDPHLSDPSWSVLTSTSVASRSCENGCNGCDACTDYEPTQAEEQGS